MKCFEKHKIGVNYVDIDKEVRGHTWNYVDTQSHSCS